MWSFLWLIQSAVLARGNEEIFILDLMKSPLQDHQNRFSLTSVQLFLNT